MTTQNNNQALRITELDFLSIKENLKNYLRNQSEFQDFDFEGSGMSVLLDVLSYNTHYMAFYLNMIGNEMFLDTAQIRASVLSHAKMIGYVPTSKQGASAKVNIRVTPSVNESNTSIATLERYTRFLAQDIDGINYPFVTLYSNTVSKSNGTFDFNNINLKQGEVVTLQYIMESTNASRRFEIPSANVDLSTVSIRVQESTTNTLTTVYTPATDITELTSKTPAYFIEENENLNYTFYFGDDVLGKKPKIGNVIICTYIDTVGSEANNISRFSFVDPIGGLFNDNVSITTVSTSSGGTEKETIEQTRFRAPYFYTTQNRAVTKNDYETLILKDFPNIDSVSIWGGEDNDPVVYGKVYLSVKPRGIDFLTNLEKENIKNFLIKTRNVLTITPEIVDPDYVYILIRGKVNYNPSATSRTSNEIVSLARAAVSDYVADELNRFDSTFRKSKLQSYIESSDPSILGSDVSIYLQKRVVLDVTRTKGYDIKYNLPLRKGDYATSLYTTPQISVFDSNSVVRQIYFEEKPLSATGIDSIVVLNPGVNYFSTPTITINGDGSGARATAVVKGSRISSINITNRGSNYTRAEVIISSVDGREAVAVPRLESRFGVLRSYYFRDNGDRVILNENAGTIDYDSGIVSVNAIRTLGTPENSLYDTNVVTFNFPAEREIITPLRNRILTVDEDDILAIQLEAVTET
jgi:hypothetical protein